MSKPTIPASVMASVALHDEAVAVVEGDRRVTYAQLGARVIEATRAMIAAGVGPGDRVGVWAPNSLGWIVAALGAQSAGAAIIPINTRWKGDEAAYVLAAGKAKLLCTTIGFLDTDTVAMLAAASIPTPHLERIVLLEDSPSRHDRGSQAPLITTWDQFVDQGDSTSEETAWSRLDSVEPTDTCDILFTSGTTGRPKGVVMTHGQTVPQFSRWCDFAGLVAGDRYLIVNPFFHMFGYKAGWFASLLRGATIYPVQVFNVVDVLTLIERERITVMPGAPTIYRTILDHPDRTKYDLGSLRVAVTGAADIPVSLIEEIRAELPFQAVLTGYGLTELGTCTTSQPDDDAETVATTAGCAVAGVEVKIVDTDGHELPRGSTGELIARSESVMIGYLDDPAATAEAIDADGFLHTGDLATMDERGYVRIVGRLKDMFIVGGFNVYPAEIENTLLAHDDIGQVAVIGVPDERMGEVGMAWVVPAPGRTPHPDEIVAWSRERMANYKAPRKVAIVDSLPMNAAGKVLKHELRALAANRSVN